MRIMRKMPKLSSRVRFKMATCFGISLRWFAYRMFGIAEEVSFYLIPDGVLIVGDLMSGGRKDCSIPDGKLGFKDSAYLVDLAKARLSLKTLLHLEFNALCFGHGKPILSGAKDVLKRFVECDATWEELGQRREEGFRLDPELRNFVPHITAESQTLYFHNPHTTA